MILVKKSLLHPKSQCVYSFVVITILLFHEISSVGMKLNFILLNEWKNQQILQYFTEMHQNKSIWIQLELLQRMEVKKQT